jgi:hypothetical protein
MRNLLGALSVASFIALAPAAIHAQGQPGPRLELSGTWEGSYSYMASSGRREVPFTLQLTQRGTSLAGRITEPNTFGERSTPNLYANVVGVQEGLRLRLVKTYDGTGGQTHSVYYESMLDPGAMTISGTWILADRWSGEFRAAKK